MTAYEILMIVTLFCKPTQQTSPDDAVIYQVRCQKTLVACTRVKSLEFCFENMEITKDK